MFNNSNDRPSINYPCEWEYRVIGRDIDRILSAIDEAACGLKYSVSPSNVSRNDKYFSINFRIEVPNETTRDVIYNALVNNDDIRIVL
ncbi:MAG: DUF493 domain-containing protein [Ignavibacteriaceae bacterium]